VSRRVIRLDLEYEGTDFRGFAPQPGLRTVDGELRAVLNRILEDDPQLTPAARTDAGVHARGQVVSFATTSTLPASDLENAINALAPRDLCVTHAFDADGFDARRDATSRAYEYLVWNAPRANIWNRRWAAHVDEPLNLEAMDRSCKSLIGRHDFGAFYTHRSQDDVPRGTDRRVLDASWVQDESDARLLHFHIEADAFLRHMVRAIVGSSILVGRGKLPAEGVAAMLSTPERAAGGPTAPACGLTLTKVAY
jgi:tRNA pseudouridine38-40 synthase